ncbi:S-adenosyl-L-methionine-dependent methyltransferase [Xylariales sp. PMI_506]|nr:S-adenosyl-L-methionine-dependent methyltransferase [Xylariales sp. PMI_506]
MSSKSQIIVEGGATQDAQDYVKNGGNQEERIEVVTEPSASSNLPPQEHTRKQILNMPVLSSQPVQYLESLPPSFIFSENKPVPDPLGTPFDPTEAWLPSQPEPNYAAQANELINSSLGRTPEGGSVVDPDSVLGESGRLYHGHKDGKYFLPNDAAEQDRLDFQHQMFHILLDGWWGLAPMTKVPSYVLDIATGTGIWALDFAERFPSSFVIGTDLSAIQPVPRVPNCVFIKDDSEAPWVFPAPHPPDTPPCTDSCSHKTMFDYVHLRAVVSCFADTRTVMQQAYDNMNSGGWIEFQDADFEVKDDSSDWQGELRFRAVWVGAASMGRNVTQVQNYKSWLEEIGFVDVVDRPILIPNSPWPQDPNLKKVGHYQLRNIVDGLRGISWQLASLSGMPPDEIETLVAESIEYLKDSKHHPYVTLHIVYGRKP